MKKQAKRETKTDAEAPPTKRSNRRRASEAPAVSATRKTPRKGDASLRTRAILARERFMQVGHRLGSRFGRIAWIAGTIALAVVAGRAIERHARSSETFAIHSIEIDGLSHLSREALLEAGGIREGMNAFEVIPDVVEARLLDHRWIRSAEVQRRLPSTLRIMVSEHEPAAILVFEDVTYLVSQEGSVFKQLGGTDPVNLPVITGVDRTRFMAAASYRSGILGNVLRVLQDYPNTGLAERDPIAEVHVEADDSLSLYVGRDAIHIRLGRPPFRAKLRRLRAGFDRIRRDGQKPVYVYADNERNPDRITVRVR